MLTSALLLIHMLIADPPASGAYTLTTQNGACQIILDESAQPLPDTNLTSQDVSGFAAAMPNCPGRVGETAFWRYVAGTSTLTLYDASGQSVFSAVRQDRIWDGRLEDQSPASLTRR